MRAKLLRALVVMAAFVGARQASALSISTLGGFSRDRQYYSADAVVQEGPFGFQISADLEVNNNFAIVLSHQRVITLVPFSSATGVTSVGFRYYPMFGAPRSQPMQSPVGYSSSGYSIFVAAHVGMANSASTVGSTFGISAVGELGADFHFDSPVSIRVLGNGGISFGSGRMIFYSGLIGPTYSF